VSDLDDATLRESAVIFSPHPDDETLGCGGTIIKKNRVGGRVDLVFVTDGSRSHARVMLPEQMKKFREAEARSAAGILGIDESRMTFLRYENNRLVENEKDAVGRVEEILKRIGASQIFVPCCMENIPDHRLTRRIVLRAIRNSGKAVDVYEYPIWSWLHWPWISLPWRHPRRLMEMFAGSLTAGFGLKIFFRFRSSVYIGDVLESKRRALGEYRSQMTRLIPDVAWPTLGDVCNGEFLDCFFHERELFYHYRIG
jgi:LmbE family N-acetylglucosaminyl deacetylase